MRTTKFTPEQMVHILRQGDSGVPVVELCRQHGISEQTFHRWRKRFGDLDTAEGRALRQLPAFLVLNAVVLNLVLGLLPWTPNHKTVFNNTASFVVGRAGTDSWGQMHVALDVSRTEPARPLYREVFFERHIRFPYAPQSLLLTAAVERLPVNPVHLLTALSWLAVCATGVVTGLLFRRSAGGEARAGPSTWLLAAGYTLTFYPIVKGFTLGQIQTWINALLAGALLAWMAGRAGTAGVLAALPCLVKPQYGVLLLWGIVRRQWRFSRAFAVTLLVPTAVSLLLFGVRDHLDYLWMLSYVSAHGESYAANHSVNGLLQHMLFNGDNLGWKEDAYPPYNPWIHGGTIAASTALILACLFRRPGGRDRPATTPDFMLAVLTCVMASPVAWEHHYGILLPIYAVLFPALTRRPVFGRWTIPALAASYVLASNYFGITRSTAATAFNFVQSYLFFAALFVLACLYALRAGPGKTSRSYEPRTPRGPRRSPREREISGGRRWAT
jgi:alpha-1,2-mannosyltransferase